MSLAMFIGIVVDIYFDVLCIVVVIKLNHADKRITI